VVEANDGNRSSLKRAGSTTTRVREIAERSEETSSRGAGSAFRHSI
jgi:hypothetical protein